MKSNPELDAIVKRPVQHLAHWAHKYPLLWREHDQRIAAIKKTSPWPSWCYAPHFVTAGCDSLQPILKDLKTDGYDSDMVDSLSTLAAWRVTKGIYLYDPTIYDELWKTPLEGDLPVELLTRLPEWCVYIPLQEPFTMGGLSAAISSGIVKTCYGVFAHLDYKPGGEILLVLTLDIYNSEVEEMHRKLKAAGRPDLVGKYDLIALAPVVLRLNGGTLERCLEAERNRVLKELETKYAGDPEVAQYKAELLEWAMEQQTKLIRPIVSLLLYLCSTEPDVRPDPLRGLRNQPVKTKQGIRNFGPPEPLLYEVAYRIGAALRLAQEVHGRAGDGTHGSPRPHIRKAHWHAFWTGPRAVVGKDQPTERKLILKWVAPIAVCAGGEPGDTIIPTVHPVLV